jgi:hypothetical protein
MVMSKEEKREYMKQYYQKNKEEYKEYRKEYYKNNKKKIKEYQKEYNKDWKEQNKEYIKEYQKTPQGKKSSTISKWKRRGLICPDIDSLYCHYLNATECEMCDITFGERGDGSGTFKCMDHSHQTGLFRNFLCHTCNIRRG